MSIHAVCESTLFNRTLFEIQSKETAEQLYWLQNYNVYYHSYVSSLVSGIGIFGNLMLFIILTRPSMMQLGGHGSVHVLLAAIAVADFLTNLTNFLYVVGRLLAVSSCNPEFMYNYYWNVFVLIHADASVFLHAASLHLTVALAVLRVFVLCCQTRKRLNQISTGCWSVLVTTVLVGASCIPNFLRNDIQEIEGGLPHWPWCENDTNIIATTTTTTTTMITTLVVDSLPMTTSSPSYQWRYYDIKFPSWWNCTLEKVSFWVYGIMSKIIPCILLTVFMACLMNILFTARRRRQRLLTTSQTQQQQHCSSSGSGGDGSPADRTSVLLFSIVFIFWLTELPHGIILILSAFDPLIFAIYRVVGDILDLLSLINSSVNFALYCSMSAKFRHEFVSMLKCNYSNSSSPPRSTVVVNRAQRSTAMPMMATNNHHHNAAMDSSVSTSLLKKVRGGR